MDLRKIVTAREPKWQRKVLVQLAPDFLIGHPNLWDNLKTLFKHPHFRPLRMAVIAYLIFMLTLGTAGIYLLSQAPQAQAQTDFSIQTGYYLGTGATLSITGLGFTPQVVIIKSDTAVGNLIWKSTVMPESVTAYFNNLADNTETAITLNADGFTVSSLAEANTLNIRYIYIAFSNSDCTVNGTMCVGVYNGNGSSTQSISTGFQPDLVWVKRTTAISGMFRTSSMPINNAAYFSSTANNTTGVFFTTLDTTGFTVGSTHNTIGGVFYYVAFKNLANKLTVSQFTGDGTDNRNITGVGFKPNFVFLKQTDAGAAIGNITQTYGDYSFFIIAAVSAVNNIQELQTDGFQVGNSVNVNVSAIVNYYFVFGGAPAPNFNGSFFMQRGSYTGNGATQSINVSFAPDLVIIKGDIAQYAVWSTSMNNNFTHYFSYATVGFTDGITAIGSNNFSVGANAAVNAGGTTYEYIAFGNATTPQKGAKAADFIIGVYTGNGINNRKIDNLGIGPNLVTVKQSAGSVVASWQSSVMATNTSAYFSAAADTTDGTVFQTLNSDGFTIGTSATINGLNTLYVWFAFKSGLYFNVNSYTGDGVADRNITGIGFNPDFVWIKRNTAVRGVHRSTSPTITGAYSQHFMNVANENNMITGFVSDGFKVGSSTEVNVSAGAYRYAAWDSSTSSNPPSTPTNSSPSSGATAQNLNATLIGSAYSDPDSNPQTDVQWQVDDDSDFSSAVWTRTAGSAGTSTAITAANGTFSNELSGKTELDHNSTYYWQVRYSDSVWSIWSTATNFTTNIISIPTNSSPANESTVTTLTPVLTALGFSDSQSGHTASSSQWQINTSSGYTANGFSSPLYDSGVINYSSSHTVPSATLSDRNVYYWRVRYKDSSGQWSSYSTATKFLVSESMVSVTPLFGSTVVDQGDNIKIDAQVKLTDGTIINNATTTINIYNPSGTKIVNAAVMPYVTDSSGAYRYSFTVPSTSGSYLYEVTAVSNNVSGYGAANFEVRTIAADVSSTKSTVTDVQTKVTDVQTKVTNIQSNVDILIGAMIVTQSTVNDASASTTSFISSLTNSTNNFYKNAVLTFTSSTLDGQSRRISAYNGATKQITLDPALTSAPANGDTFTIISQNVRVEEQVTEHETAQASFRTDTTSRLTSIESKIDTIITNLNTVDANLDSVLSTVNSIRTSQQKDYKATLSDVSEIQASSTYRAKLILLNFESNPVDASTTPTIMIYDATRAVAQATTTMTKLSTGVYEYAANISSSATTGLWETIVNVDVGGTANIVRNDYWQVTGAPAQAVINSISDLTVPSIAANVTITNEGGGQFEYQYEWCVVNSQENQCGGSDDVYYGSAAKLIAAGDSFNPTLTATVPIVGDYWFKVVVYYGTEASGASRTFTATSEAAPSPGGGGGGAIAPSLATTENIYSEIIKARNQLDLNSQKLVRVLDILGVISPATQNLLSVNILNTEKLIDIQNKVADLRAVSAATRRTVEQKTVEPIVETYMKFNSVEIHFLITNPDSNQRVVKFKAFLPEEARPEHILDLSGLKVDYDTNAKVYYVSGDITLGPKETVTRKVEMKDIWVFAPEEIKSIKDQSNGLVPTLAKTQYEAQGAILKNDIDSTLNIVLLRQEEGYSSPQDHIVVYRENKERMTRAENNLEKLKDLVVQAGASRGVVGQIGGIQTFATWGIILAIIFGFGLLAAVIFAMWRHQTMLAAVTMGMNKNEAVAQFGGVIRKRRKLLGQRQITEISPQSAQTSFIWRLPWKKILIGIVAFAIVLTLIIVSVKFAPMMLDSRRIQFENKETPVMPQEKSIGSKLRLQNQ